MWRFEVLDITEQQFRALRLLIHLKQAEAHIIVRSNRPWPPEISTSPRQREVSVPRDAIN